MHPATLTASACMMHHAHVSGWFRAPACLRALQSGARKSNAGAHQARMSRNRRVLARGFLCPRRRPGHALKRAGSGLSLPPHPPPPPPTHPRNSTSVDTGTGAGVQGKPPSRSVRVGLSWERRRAGHGRGRIGCVTIWRGRVGPGRVYGRRERGGRYAASAAVAAAVPSSVASTVARAVASAVTSPVARAVARAVASANGGVLCTAVVGRGRQRGCQHWCQHRLRVGRQG